MFSGAVRVPNDKKRRPQKATKETTTFLSIFLINLPATGGSSRYKANTEGGRESGGAIAKTEVTHCRISVCICCRNMLPRTPSPQRVRQNSRKKRHRKVLSKFMPAEQNQSPPTAGQSRPSHKEARQQENMLGRKKKNTRPPAPLFSLQNRSLLVVRWGTRRQRLRGGGVASPDL